jgi:hypothetical protein
VKSVCSRRTAASGRKHRQQMLTTPNCGIYGALQRGSNYSASDEFMQWLCWRDELPLLDGETQAKS